MRRRLDQWQRICPTLSHNSATCEIEHSMHALPGEQDLAAALVVYQVFIRQNEDLSLLFRLSTNLTAALTYPTVLCSINKLEDGDRN